MKNDFNIAGENKGGKTYGCIIKLFDQSPEKPSVLAFLKENVIFAGYIIPNIVNYGLDTDFFECFYAKNGRGDISFAATRYHDSAQVFCKEQDPSTVRNFVSLVKDKGIKRISGNFDFVEQMKAYFAEATFEEGKVAILDNKTVPGSQTRYPCLRADTMEDFIKLAELLMEDESFAKNYSVDSLSKQFYERSRSKNGRNYYISDDKGVVLCHVGTYAECSDLAVIGGVKTRNGFYGNGYATALICYLKNILGKEGKSIILYFYDPELLSFYNRFGFLQLESCAKIELF
ncbi:MAG: hypothetical protein IKZ47_02685 [Clostridia bacterium]|nr:hypothetical protein [Clostridia bacterium]